MTVEAPIVDGSAGKFVYPFAMTSTTATVLLIRRNLIHPERSTFLSATRAKHVRVFPGWASLPGGFLNAKVVGKDGEIIEPGETVEDTAVRELIEETNITANKDDLQLFNVDTDPNLDPRAHVTNVCFWYEVSDEQAAGARPGDDIERIEWPGIGSLTKDVPMAFNHLDIARKGIRHWARWNGIKL